MASLHRALTESENERLARGPSDDGVVL